MAYSWWQKALGWLRKLLNAANAGGMIPSQKPGANLPNKTSDESPR